MVMTADPSVSGWRARRSQKWRGNRNKAAAVSTAGSGRVRASSTKTAAVAAKRSTRLRLSHNQGREREGS